MKLHFATEANMSAILHDCRFSGGISASGQSAGFGGNLFTRDTLRVLRDVMGIPGYQSFIREMLGVLPQWQGTHEDPATNEFPDALSHQVFRSVVGGRQLPDQQIEVARHWAHEWRVPMTTIANGGEQFVIYNSSDGPLLYLITLGEYIQTYGDSSILKDRFYHHPSETTRTVGEAAHRCIRYVERALRESPDGLYSVPNTNVLQTSPSGVMRDGSDAYVRSDGTPADYGRVAYIENQGLAHHALQMAVNVLFPDEQEARVRLTLAHNLRDATIERFWMEDKSFFAAAIDRNGQIDMLSSAVFELLDSPFFEGVKGGGDYVEGLVRKLYDDESFMTPIGARMISLEQSYLEGDGYYSYQGSGVVWPVTNGIIANGLSRWSLHWLARDLGVHRLVGGIEQSRQVFELTYVHRSSNAPMYKTSNHKVGGDLKKVIYASDRAQPNQAWTASAGLRQLHRLAQPTESKSYNPHLELLDEYMAKKLLDGEMPTAIDSVPNKYFVTCDYDEGARLKSERAAALKGMKSRPREI